MGREFEAERKKWPLTRFFVTAALFHAPKLRSNRNQDQTLRFVFNTQIIMII
jgi:hypothetical protein